MTPIEWILAGAVGGAPLVAVAWVRWRYNPKHASARADKLLADAKARMQTRDDDALVALFVDLGDSRSARRIAGLLDEKRFMVLQREWGDLWPDLLKDGLLLDRAIDLGAALNVLAERHPS